MLVLVKARWRGKVWFIALLFLLLEVSLFVCVNVGLVFCLLFF